MSTTNTVNLPLSGTQYTIPTNAPIGSITINTVGGGGGSGSNYITGTNNWTVMPSPSFTSFNTGIKITPQDGGEAIIETNHSKINLDQLNTMLTEMLAFVYEDKELHNKHPTLADAYERWKVAYDRTLQNIQIDPEQRELSKEYQTLKAMLTAK